jgi:kinesin family protein 3/17
MLELYNEEIVDLFSREAGQKLQLHEDKDKGIYVKDLSSEMVTTVEEMNKKLVEGSNNRHVGRTDMNEVSSRSHCIFMIRIEQEQIIKGESKIRAGKLNLVDLAGSERQKKTQATGSRSKEGIYINLALSTLGQVIKALVSSNNGHIPYRDSKLTRLLQ